MASMSKEYVGSPIDKTPLLKEYLTVFKEPDHRKKFKYATTLFATGEKKLSTEYEEAQQALQKNTNPSVTALPTPTATDADELKPLWPFGIAWHQPNENSVLLTRDSYLNAGDISENFMLNPLDEQLRTKLQATVFGMLQQFLHGNESKMTEIPQSMTSAHDMLAKKVLLAQRAARTYAPSHAWLTEKAASCVWMDIKSFKAKGPESLDSILNSGINIVWLDIIPEIFISANARCGKNKEEFYTNVEWFTRNLQERAQKLNKPLPFVFMGTDVTLNYKTMPNCPIIPVDNPTVNMYGKELTRIPSPLDIPGFWQTQVAHVITTFVQEWNAKVGNGLPLSGVFFDLEMYQAQDQASSYEDTMDFSDLAWNIFLKAHPQKELPVLATVADRVQYLLSSHQMDAYMSLLHQEAQRAGSLVHSTIKKLLPNAMIGVYNANMPCSSFYRGFLERLSSPQEPIICATFNTTFYKHAQWLEKQGVFMHHLQVLMLSKLRKQEDFKQIDEILEHHDGIWFNRFSRLAEDPLGNPDHIESSPLPAPVVVKEINQHLESVTKK